ncbi:MAG: cupin domain-containing protein [Bacteroidota bacterium]
MSQIQINDPMEIKTVNLNEKFAAFNEHWSPKIAGELNGQMVKLAKLQGEFVMHKHDAEDELFFVVEGKLFMELEDQTLEINPGEFVIIPKGMMHKPYAPEEVKVMLFEPATTLNTGTEVNERTVSDLERI